MNARFLRRSFVFLLVAAAFGATLRPGHAADAASGAQAVAARPFDAETAVGDAVVPLRGRHKLTWWGFDVYTAAFYGPADRTTYDRMLAADAPRVLVLRYHRSIKAADIARATERKLGDNPDADLAALRERLDALYECYSDVRDGDEYRIAYDPATKSTAIALNGEPQCTVAGADFASAFFGIWLGPHSISREMSRRLRGGK